MKYLPEPPDEPEDEKLSAEELHDRWEDVTNLGAAELRDVLDSERNDEYKERNSEMAQEGDEPLRDAIMLAETPAEEWDEEEVEEAREALDFISRTAAQGAEKEKEGAMLPEEPHYGKQEMSLVRWGVDPFPEDGWP